MSGSLQTSLEQLDSSLPIVNSPELSSAVHWTPSASLPVHRWFRYREGFSPYLLEHFSDAYHRLDPFCGCGTTLLESALKRSHSYGIDLNPLATFVTRTKTKQYSNKDQAAFEVLSEAALAKYPGVKPAPLPEYPLLGKLFFPQSMDVLLRLKHFISEVEPSRIQDLLLLAWLSILEDSSNAFKEGNGLKYRNKRRKPGRYITLPEHTWVNDYFGDNIGGFVENLWTKKCAQIAEDLVDFRVPKGFAPRVRTGSCMDAHNLDFGRLFDLAIFSPPYANRFDYFEAFKIELWMGGFVTESSHMATLRRRSMKNNLTAERIDSPIDWPELTPFLHCMDDTASSVRMGIKNTLEGYFSDTRTLLKNLTHVLASHAKVVIVVGNSAYAKSIVPTDALVATIAREEGYKVASVKVARHLHVSSQQRSSLQHLQQYMRESVVILELAN